MGSTRDGGGAGGAGLSVQSLPCLAGTKWGKPLVLPTEVVEGRTCVALCAFEPWVNKALCGSARGACSEVVGGFIQEVYAALGYECAQKSSEDEAASGASGGESGGSCFGARGGGSCLENRGGGSCPASPAAEKALSGRAALGLDDDSDMEALVALGEDTKPSSRKSLKPPAVWSTVAVRGEELTLRRRPRGRGLLLPLDGPELPLVFGMLMADMAAQAKAGAPKRQRADRSAVELVECDLGRVLWLPSQAAWQVVFRDADGAIRRTQKGFKVPTAGVAGVKLTAEQRDAARRSLLVLARQRWNQLDASTAERYKAVLLELPDSA